MNERKVMGGLLPDVPAESQSTTIIVVGSSNCPAFDPKDMLPSCLSTTYTVGSVAEAADNQPHGAPSGPLKEGAVRAMNSVIRTRVPESAILRGTGGDF
jgi:hypothetical protein